MQRCVSGEGGSDAAPRDRDGLRAGAGGQARRRMEAAISDDAESARPECRCHRIDEEIRAIDQVDPGAPRAFIERFAGFVAHSSTEQDERREVVRLEDVQQGEHPRDPTKCRKRVQVGSLRLREIDDVVRSERMDAAHRLGVTAMAIEQERAHDHQASVASVGVEDECRHDEIRDLLVAVRLEVQPMKIAAGEDADAVADTVVLHCVDRCSKRTSLRLDALYGRRQRDGAAMCFSRRQTGDRGCVLVEA
ncbi:MAG: hypothetical protein U0359_07085 [Byssovorax sp.]